jgi:hypothetical protein
MVPDLGRIDRGRPARAGPTSSFSAAGAELPPSNQEAARPPRFAKRTSGAGSATMSARTIADAVRLQPAGKLCGNASRLRARDARAGDCSAGDRVLLVDDERLS